MSVDPAATQEAQLVTSDDSSVVATVEVAAFPANPGVVVYEGRYFANGMVGYGETFLTYTETTGYVVPTGSPT